jgi:hypothetical protein
VIDPEEVQRHKLPDTDNQRIFAERIVPDLLEGRTAQPTPSVVFLVGQPGAGKSKVTEMIADVLNRRGGFIDVDSDLYKPYHPEYDDLMAQDDTLMAAYTRADGRTWMAQAEGYVRENRLNAVIQETSQNAEAVEGKMTAYRQAGFRVEALVMGVPEAMSNQGIVNRYCEQVRDRGQGRLTVQSNADESYAGILDLADRIDRGKLADQVSVFRRGEGKPRYNNALDATGQWQTPPALRQAIETERTRPWTEAETSSFVNTQERLRVETTHMGPEWPPRLTRIENLARPLVTPEGVQTLTRINQQATARQRAAAANAGSVTVEQPPSRAPGPRPEAAPRQPNSPHRDHGRGPQR